MSTDLNLAQTQKEWHGTLKFYLIGFFTCILLTTISFYLVWSQAITGQNLIYIIIGLAILQIAAQLRYFLHLGQEPKPQWETMAFAFMILILFIIVAGTLWIMNDLNERTMSGIMENMTHD